MPKKDSPCMDYGYYSDGVAIFWKTERFEKIGQGSFYGKLKNSSRGVGMVRLKSAFAGVEPDQQQEIVVAGTHLKAKEVIVRSPFASVKCVCFFFFG